MANRDADTAKESNPAEPLIDAMGASAGQEAYGHIVGLRRIIETVVSPPLSQAALAQMQQLKVSSEQVVAESPDDFVVHNSPEQAAAVLAGRQEALLTLIETTLRHALR